MATDAIRTRVGQKRASARRRIPERPILGAGGFVAFLVLWESLSRLGVIKKAVFSSPTLIWDAAVRDTTSGAIWPHIATSGEEYLLGLAIAMAVAIPLGLLIGLSWRLDFMLNPWISAIYATPLVALVPLIILVFGIGLEAKVVVVFLEAVFVIMVSVITGVKATEVRFHDIAQSFRASPWVRFRTVVLPATVPFILTGARLGTGRGIVGVVISEFIAANQGIGFYISINASLLQSSRVYFGIILLGLVGLVIGEVVRRAEHSFDRWRPQIN